MLFAAASAKGVHDSPVTYVSRGVHRVCEPWQPKLHGRALARSARDGYRAAVGLDDRLDDRHAEAGAALRVRLASEALEDARGGLRGDGRAGVADTDDRVVDVRAAGHDDAVAGPGRLDRVLDERVDRGDEALLVGAHRAAARRLDLPLTVAGGDAPAAHGARDQGGQAHGAHAGEVRVLGGGEDEQPVGDAREALQLLDDD